MKAVETLLALSAEAWTRSRRPRVRTPSSTAATAARKPTKVACTWGGAQRGPWESQSSMDDEGMDEWISQVHIVVTTVHSTQ